MEKCYEVAESCAGLKLDFKRYDTSFDGFPGIEEVEVEDLGNI